MKSRILAALVRKFVSSPLAAGAVLLWAAAASLAQAAPAAQTLNDALEPGSALWLTGDSTLHVWHSSATHLDADTDFSAPASALRERVAKGGLKNLSVSVPVKGLKSGEGGLDKNMYKALKEDRFHDIRFTLEDYKTGVAKDGGLQVTARGKLSVAGVEKETVIVGACRFSGRVIEIVGSKDILMTDYGVKPPVLMLGTLKTANKVIVHFDLKLKASAAVAAK